MLFPALRRLAAKKGQHLLISRTSCLHHKVLNLRGHTSRTQKGRQWGATYLYLGLCLTCIICTAYRQLQEEAWVQVVILTHLGTHTQRWAGLAGPHLCPGSAAMWALACLALCITSSGLWPVFSFSSGTNMIKAPLSTPFLNKKWTIYFVSWKGRLRKVS